METTTDQRQTDSLRIAVEAMNAQTAATTALIFAVTRLVEAIAPGGVAPALRLACDLKLGTPRPRWFYRYWIKKSDKDPNPGDDHRARDPTWALDSYREVALHFAEFHADEYNHKGTALISGTTDVIRALKGIYEDYEKADLKTRDPTKFMITIIHTTEYYLARELIDHLDKAGLWYHLSSEARQRLELRPHLHESEVVFLHKIRKDDIKLEVSLQGLDKTGIWSCIPELQERDKGKRIFPKLIRRRILENSDWKSTTAAHRFKDIYSMLTQNGSTRSTDSLVMAQALLVDDERLRSLDGSINDEGEGILQDEIIASRTVPIVLRGRKQDVGFAD
ncbi:hypothetical protein O9K51_10741 [Purpureocillium lavendulum]|uniref:Uncharacterized protein n=1 Tax=Purpureocillium lavendulum TaxID=1247861 RepID=A0AB34FCL5_9HYPO|nr:hypothetical protein O9K51_10741 [Purpureocillium lavendulum]